MPPGQGQTRDLTTQTTFSLCSLFLLRLLISSFSAVIITTAAKGWQLTSSISMGCNNLLSFSTKMVIFLLRTGYFFTEQHHEMKMKRIQVQPDFSTLFAPSLFPPGPLIHPCRPHATIFYHCEGHDVQC